jgi:hypothetical protein
LAYPASNSRGFSNLALANLLILLDDLESTNLKNQFWQHSFIPSGIIEKDLSEKAYDLDDDKAPTEVLESLLALKLIIDLPFIPLAKREKFRIIDKSEIEKVEREV